MHNNSHFQPGLSFAKQLDASDELRSFRNEFLIPPHQGAESIYLCGNSLGLQPKTVKARIEQELKDWATLGVEGHLQSRTPWLSYHEVVTEGLAQVVGAKPLEVVAMNCLTVNLHLLMMSFYRPQGKRNKILIEASAFPSDQYAVASQAHLHGLDANDVVVEACPRPGENVLRTEDILKTIEELNDTLALVMFGGVNYLTGQAFDLKAITEAAHAVGAKVGFDLAHAAGNLHLKLHDWGPDFATWCSYKYLNSGPGGIAGIFVHERHASNFSIPRCAGWWGHNKKTRFKMDKQFDPLSGAEGWQLSNPPIFQLAAHRASLELFTKAGMENLRNKSEKLTAYMEFLLDSLVKAECESLTPRDPKSRGCQLSLRFKRPVRDVFHALTKSGVICDMREPDVIRVAPTPLYNSFEDVFQFVSRLSEILGGKK